jgi:hypothetical protein
VSGLGSMVTSSLMDIRSRIASPRQEVGSGREAGGDTSTLTSGPAMTRSKAGSFACSHCPTNAIPSLSSASKSRPYILNNRLFGQVTTRTQQPTLRPFARPGKRVDLAAPRTPSKSPLDTKRLR